MFEPAWLGEADARSPDSRVAFRGAFTLLRSCAVEFRVLGASWFIAWLDTRELPRGWQAPQFDDSSWPRPVAQELRLGEFRPLKIGPIRHQIVQPQLIAQGTLSGPFESAEKPNWPEEGDVSWYKRN